ncbi:MAG: hypothetical protein DWQ28_08015 [Proteobacteria bacterium]|nr:MAG: hypothetical protein DWQ28_08015 [Pseudomonadota bacterium]
MAFPSLTPTGRQFTPGDFPSKTFNSQSGAEVRILYGSRRVNATLSLSYVNVTDANAESFLDDYSNQLGTFRTFTLPSAVFEGWSGSTATLDAPAGTKWRYDKQPQVQAVRPGISSVTVALRAVA